MNLIELDERTLMNDYTSDLQSGKVGYFNAQWVFRHALVLALILLFAVGYLQGTCRNSIPLNRLIKQMFHFALEFSHLIASISAVWSIHHIQNS